MDGDQNAYRRHGIHLEMNYYFDTICSVKLVCCETGNFPIRVGRNLKMH